MVSRVDEQDAPEAQDEQQQHEQHDRDVRLYLAVLATHVGQPLRYNVYFDNKLIAEKGRAITERMVTRIRLLDNARLTFRND